MWWRIFIPSWRFFDTAGLHAELLVMRDGEWRPALERPPVRWWNLFFNPRGNFYHAYMNLLERLALEISAGADPEALVSFALVRDYAAGADFKLRVNGEDVLTSKVVP